MNGAFQIAGVGLTSQQRALDVIANNIANMNTRAFKRSDVRFSEIMSATIADIDVAATVPSTSPNLAGVAMRSEFMLNAQGVIDSTDQPMDIAVDGEGFIELSSQGGRPLLWRGGTLQVSADGFLATESGLVLAAQVNVPEDADEMFVDSEGIVMVSLPEGEFEEIGQISLVKVLGNQGVRRLDGGVYEVMEDAEIRDVMAGEDGAGRIVQGAVERSNVDLNREMIEMMIVQRAYAANAQVVQAADQLVSIANTLRR